MQSVQPVPALSVRRIVVAGMLSAIAILLGVTRLGFIAVPNVTGSATIMHVPAIIGGVLEGPVVGLLVGGIFGAYSFLQAADPVFKDPLVSIVPRLFIGIAAWLAYSSLRRVNEMVALVMAGVIGTLTNTALVLGMAIFRNYFPPEIVLVVLPQAIAEMVIAAVITVAVVAAWKRIGSARGGSSV
ncbi:MAG: ECF transporter S component [Litorilinea sp.]